MHVVIFEGSRWHAFAPLSLSRPVFMLGTGIGSLLDKQIHHLQPARLSLWVRPDLEAFCRERVVPKLKVPARINEPLDDEPALFVNGRTVHFGKYEYPPHDAVVMDEAGMVHSARVRDPGLSVTDLHQRTDRWLRLRDLPQMMPQSRLVDSLWDLIHWNEESLVEDSTRLPHPAPPKPAGPFHLVNAEEIWLGAGATLEPGCVLDASQGPIVLGERATIGANAVVKGPCFIGPHAVVRPLAQIRPGTSIGPVCKVGGEISNSILLGYSNKGHEGYLGHSYLGKWVNFGAGTTTSNKKNTYGEISVQIGGHTVPTGRNFLGSLVGDHTKTGILTRLTTGTYVGFCSMLAGGAAPRFVPSFTFMRDHSAEPYALDKAVEVTRRAFARRDRPWTETDEQILRYAAAVAPRVENSAPVSLV